MRVSTTGTAGAGPNGLFLEVDPSQPWQPACWHVVIADGARTHLAYLGADGSTLRAAPIDDALATLARGDAPDLAPVPMQRTKLVGAVVGVRVLGDAIPG